MNATYMSRCASRLMVLSALCLSAAMHVHAQQVRVLTPLGERVSDEIIARDLTRLDSLALLYPEDRSPLATVLARAYVGTYAARNRPPVMTRSRAYVALAREAYERNDPGTLAEQLLAVAAKRAPVQRTRRPELWTLVDSMSAAPVGVPTFDETRIALEMAIVRSQYPILGAPDCAAWDREADRLAQLLRGMIPPPTVAVVPPPVQPEPAPPPLAAPPVTLAAPAQLHGIPSMVHFALDQSYLAPASRAVLDVLVDSLRRFPDVSIVLEGHTDLRASVAYNLALSRRRTMSVRAYLAAKGVQDSRISIVAQGKSHLQSDGVGVTDHARNRRVQLRYYAPDGREIEAMQLLDDLQLESGRARAPIKPRRR